MDQTLNQRLCLASLSHQWSTPGHKYGAHNRLNDGHAYLDAEITSWNLRDKKVPGGLVTYLRPDAFAFGLAPFMSTSEQAGFKYAVYVDGHSAADRYSRMMVSGSVILKVASRVGHRLWFFDALEPYVDHVPVAAGLEDLADAIAWCKQNDAKCEDIARNARALADRLFVRRTMTAYMAELLNACAAKQEKQHAHLQVLSGDRYAAHSSVPVPTDAHLRATREAQQALLHLFPMQKDQEHEKKRI